MTGAAIPPSEHLDPTEQLDQIGLNSRLHSSLRWIGSTMILRQIITWGFTLVTARILLPADYGVMALIEAALPYLTVLCGLGTGAWLIQAPQMNKQLQQEIFGLSLVTGTIAAAGCFFLGPVAAQLFEMPALENPFRLLSLVFLAQAVSLVPDCTLRRDMKFEPIAVGKLTVGIAQGGLTLILALCGLGFWALVLGVVFGNLALSAFFVFKQGLPGLPRWNFGLYKRVVGFGLGVAAGGIFWILFSTIDDVIVGKRFGARELGFYSMAFILSNMPLAKLNEALNPVMLTYFSRVKHEAGELERTLLKFVRVTLGVLGPLMLGVVVVAPELVLLVLGEKWAPLALPLRVMALSALIKAIFAPLAVASTALGHGRIVFLYSFIPTVVLVPSFFLLSGWYGIEGIYFSWTVLYLMVSLLNLYLFSFSSGASALNYLRNLTVPLGASVIMALGVLAVHVAISDLPIVAVLAVEVVSGIALYGVALCCMSPQYAREIIQFGQKLCSGK